MTNRASNVRYLNESLQRGLRVLQAVSESPSGLTVTDLANQLQIDYSTAYRLCSTLEMLGFVRREARTKIFRPGPAALRLGYAYVQNLEVHQAARPMMEELRASLDEVVLLSQIDDDAIVLIDALRSDQILSTRDRIGARSPLHCTAAGKVALAALTAKERVKLVSRLELTRFTERTITSRSQLEAAVRDVQRKGFALSFEEQVVGLVSVAAPVHAPDGSLAAIIAVAVPTARITAMRPLRVIEDAVVEAGGEISASIGHAPAE